MNAGRPLRGFTVHADGTVIGPSGRVLKPYVNLDGYLIVGRKEAGKKVHERVHRLVCEAYHGPPPSPDHEVAHWNGDKTDNRSANVRWARRAENYDDRRRHGSANDGEGNGRSKLTWGQVEAIRSAYDAGGVSQAELGRKYGVDASTISVIVRGKTWKGARP